MWQSPNAGRGPDLNFLRAAGIILVALTIASGAVSVIGISLAKHEQEVVVAEAKTLEQGTEAMFKAVDDNIARRHEFSLE
jgi:hypothetical protein